MLSQICSIAATAISKYHYKGQRSKCGQGTERIFEGGISFLDTGTVSTIRSIARSFTRLITNPIVLMQIIGNRQLIGKKLMERESIGRIRKVYLND